ncbi:MAG: hypothetical protein KF845_12265 [Cyclobacteriaceae bacterium]|nr:hypothetical protein [Cyclobacteriaceae bacterium]
MNVKIIALLLFGIIVVSCVKNKHNALNDEQLNPTAKSKSNNVSDSLNMANLTRALKDSVKIESFIVTQYLHDSLPNGVYQLRNLKELYVSRTYLKQIPPQVCNLSKLESLDLDFNKLISIENIVCLEKLKSLSLVGNRLSHLPADLSLLSRLWFLDISNNQFKDGLHSKLPPSIEELRIANSELNHFPLEILELKKLKRLNLSDNPNLKSIPIEINSLVNLTELIISDTGISDDYKLKIQELIPNCVIYD